MGNETLLPAHLKTQTSCPKHLGQLTTKTKNAKYYYTKQKLFDNIKQDKKYLIL